MMHSQEFYLSTVMDIESQLPHDGDQLEKYITNYIQTLLAGINEKKYINEKLYLTK